MPAALTGKIPSTETDVLIIGSGVAGLFLAADIARVGFRVCIVESAAYLAAGASTKNEGMLHRGTYHAAAIEDRSTAVTVARRCSFGYTEILRRVPGAVAEPGLRSFVLVRAAEKAEEFQSKWKGAGVPYKPVSRALMQAVVPEIDDQSITAAFEVEDRSIDTRRLYRELARQAGRRGARLLTQTEVSRISARENVAELRRDGSIVERIAARTFLYAAGTALPQLLWSLLSVHVNVRFWRSHLLDLPRASTHNLFFIERDGFTLMQHGSWSIAGLNADAQQVNTPVVEPVADQVALLKSRLQRVIPKADLVNGVGRVCVKVDCEPGAGVPNTNHDTQKLSLDATYHEPLPGHMWVVPGKMTEAPHVSKVLTSEIQRRLGSASRQVSTSMADEIPIAPRPIDMRPSAAGAIAGGDPITKTATPLIFS